MRKTLLTAAFVAATATSTALIAGNRADAQVVMSEVYVGGGYASGTATWANDFVVLYNNGNTAVDLSTWALQYSAAAALTNTASTPTNTFNVYGFNAGSTIAAQGYFFIEGAKSTSTAAVGAPLPTTSTVMPGQPFADDDLSTGSNGGNVTFSLSLSGLGGQLALTTNTVALPDTYAGDVYASGAPSSYSAIDDFLGYGEASASSSTNRFEGTDALSGITSTTMISNSLRSSALGRTLLSNGMYVDTNNNNNDFALVTAVLFNSKGDVISPAAVPEPSAVALLAFGMSPLGLAVRSIRRRAKRVDVADTPRGRESNHTRMIQSERGTRPDFRAASRRSRFRRDS